MDSPNKSSVLSRVKTQFTNAEIEHFGFSKIQKPHSMEIYSQWIQTHYVGDLDYLKKHEEIKASPRKILPNAQTMISVALDYLPHTRLARVRALRWALPVHPRRDRQDHRRRRADPADERVDIAHPPIIRRTKKRASQRVSINPTTHAVLIF